MIIPSIHHRVYQFTITIKMSTPARITNLAGKYDVDYLTHVHHYNDAVVAARNVFGRALQELRRELENSIPLPDNIAVALGPKCSVCARDPTDVLCTETHRSSALAYTLYREAIDDCDRKIFEAKRSHVYREAERRKGETDEENLEKWRIAQLLKASGETTLFPARPKSPPEGPLFGRLL